MDFRAFQLVDIYADDNAYVNRGGFERPSARETNGDTRFTMRHECRLENVMGLGDSYTMSGSVWGAWNAVYGPRGPDGRPVPLWDPRDGPDRPRGGASTGEVRPAARARGALAHAGAELHGKIHIWVGEADDYFLNNAVHLLDAFLSRRNRRTEARSCSAPGRPTTGPASRRPRSSVRWRPGRRRPSP